MCTGESVYLSPSYSGNTAQHVQGIVSDGSGEILGIGTEDQPGNFPDGFCVDEPLFFNFLGYDGEIEGLELGMNLADIYGCLFCPTPLN